MSLADRDAFDCAMMANALVMARRGLGTTTPNPSVGAVIADESTGEIIARAVTASSGRPHAEPQAIAKAGARARGKTLYVTLEPCAHYGKTPPCADAIIAAGIARVVIGTGDPDPRTAGQGSARLRAAGIDVVEGVMAAEARWVTLGHILRVTERRPFVQLKIATDAQGRVPRGGDGKPLWVTSPEARAAGHMLRAEADAILIGSGTLRDDDPELTCRLPGLEHRSPIRIILAGRTPLAARARLLRRDSGPPVWITGGEKVTQIHVDAPSPGPSTGGGRIDIPQVLANLAGQGITRLLVEGGPTIWRAFADSGLVDEVVVFIAGHAPADTEARREREAVNSLLGLSMFTITERRHVGPDTMCRLRPARR